MKRPIFAAWGQTSVMLFVLGFGACSSASKTPENLSPGSRLGSALSPTAKKDGGTGETTGGGEPSQGNPATAEQASPLPELLPLAPLPGEKVFQHQPGAVVLVLGGGMAKGLAAIGVLRALKEAKIRVAAIMGREMGALIAALYAKNETLGQFEWDLLKFKPETFQPTWHYSLSTWSRTWRHEKFEQAIEAIFGDGGGGWQLEQAHLPVILEKLEEDGKTLTALRSGEVKELLEKIMAPAPTGPEQAQPLTRTALPPSLLPSLAQSLHLGPVLVIETEPAVSGDPERAGEGLSSLVRIRPDLKGIDGLAFEKMSDILFKGKQAMKKALPAVIQSIGAYE